MRQLTRASRFGDEPTVKFVVVIGSIAETIAMIGRPQSLAITKGGNGREAAMARYSGSNLPRTEPKRTLRLGLLNPFRYEVNRNRYTSLSLFSQTAMQSRQNAGTCRDI